MKSTEDMYDYVRPQKLLDALRQLKVNNPLYAAIEQWVEEAVANHVLLQT